MISKLDSECGEKIEEKSRWGIRFKWIGYSKRKCFIWKYKIKEAILPMTSYLFFVFLLVVPNLTGS